MIDADDIATFALIFLLCFLLPFCTIGIVTENITDEHIIITGSIEDYKHYDSHISLLINNKWYNCHYPSNDFTDLTDNSTLALTLDRTGWFVFFPPDNYYTIMNVLKLPKK